MSCTPRPLQFPSWKRVGSASRENDTVRDGTLLTPRAAGQHKLIVSRMRIETPESQTKARKDLRQARELLNVLCEHWPYEIKDLGGELTEQGPQWR